MSAMTSLERFRGDPASFIERYLYDPETKKPFKLLDAERAFLEHAFKLGTGGRLLFPEQVYSAPKKSGKTAFAAMHMLVTTLLFGGRYSEAYSVANDLEQAQSRVFEMVRRIVEASPLLKSECKVVASSITFRDSKSVITAIASDYAGAAGGHPTISSFDELWGSVSERSRRLWDELVPVPTRKVSLRLVTTYAGFSGESNLLEELYKRGMSLPEVGPDLRAGDGLLFFWSHVPIASWQDDRWLAEMRRSLRPNQYLRMIENRFTSGESNFIEMAWWDDCVDPQLSPVFSDRSMPIWIGVDASVKRDSTALVAVTYDAQTQGVRLVNHRIFQPTSENPINFEAMVEHTLLEWSQRYKVQEILFDPFQMIATAQRLQSIHRLPMQEYAQTVSNLTATSQGLYELVKGRNLVAYPDEEIRLAVSRAVASESARGWKISKDKQSHKIDVLIALSMAALAAVRANSKTRRKILYGTIGVHGEVDEIDLETGRFIKRDNSTTRIVLRDVDESGHIIQTRRLDGWTNIH